MTAKFPLQIVLTLRNADRQHHRQALASSLQQEHELQQQLALLNERLQQGYQALKVQLKSTHLDVASIQSRRADLLELASQQMETEQRLNEITQQRETMQQQFAHSNQACNKLSEMKTTFHQAQQHQRENIQQETIEEISNQRIWSQS